MTAIVGELLQPNLPLQATFLIELPQKSINESCVLHQRVVTGPQITHIADGKFQLVKVQRCFL